MHSMTLSPGRKGRPGSKTLRREAFGQLAFSNFGIEGLPGLTEQGPRSVQRTPSEVPSPCEMSLGTTGSAVRAASETASAKRLQIELFEAYAKLMSIDFT